MALRCLLLAVATVGCHGTERVPPSCQLGAVLERWHVPTAEVQCGSLPVSADEMDYLDARDCVLAAADDRRSFIVFWETDGFLGANAIHGYTGVWRDGVATIYRFESNPAPDGERDHEYTDLYRCSELVAESGCSSGEGNLCLRCVEQTVAELCCELPPDFEDCLHL